MYGLPPIRRYFALFHRSFSPIERIELPELSILLRFVPTPFIKLNTEPMSLVAQLLPDAEFEEMQEIEMLMAGRSVEEIKKFIYLYRGRRKEQQTTLILCLVGLFGFAGLHRLVNGDIGIGLLFFFTGGLCMIGTIVDLVNYRRLNLDANRRIMRDVAQFSYAPSRF
jgi:TM2 domain-containing membrane protein YozV